MHKGIESNRIRQGVSSKNLDLKNLPDTETPDNNNRGFRLIRSLSSTEGYPLSDEIGTYDTIKLTSNGVRRSDLKQIFHWDVGSNTRVGDLQDGHPIPLKLRLYIDAEGDETDKGNSVATIGIDFIPQRHWRTGEDICIVHISSSPALMGHPWAPLFQSEVPALIDRVQNIVSRYVDCDITTFEVSRLDSATVFNVEHPIKGYIQTLHSISSEKKWFSKRKDYPDESVGFYNDSSGVTFYDKAKNDIEKGVSPPAEYVGLNGLRYEIQNKNKQSLSSVYGGIRFLDLCRDEMVANCAKVREKQFNRFWPLKKATTYDSIKNVCIEDVFRMVNENAERNVPHQTALIYLIKEGTVTIDKWDSLLRNAGFDKDHIRRFTNGLRKLSNVSIESRNLYAEIYEFIQNDLKLVA